MRSPVPQTTFFIFLFILLLLFLVIQLHAIGFVFSKLGLSRNGAALLLFSSLFGSMINLPLFRLRSNVPIQQPPVQLLDSFWQRRRQSGFTIIALNTGGALIPLSFSIYLMLLHRLPPVQIVGAIAVTSLISYLVSKPIKGVGIGIPLFIAPVSAALTALLIDPAHAAPLAYIGGTLGVLIGADLLRMGSIRNMGVAVASIGGAGTFDGIFITGIIAVLLT